MREKDLRLNLLLFIEIDDVLRRICVSDRSKSSRDNWKEEDEEGEKREGGEGTYSLERLNDERVELLRMECSTSNRDDYRFRRNGRG